MRKIFRFIILFVFFYSIYGLFKDREDSLCFYLLHISIVAAGCETIIGKIIDRRNNGK